MSTKFCKLNEYVYSIGYGFDQYLVGAHALSEDAKKCTEVCTL